MPHNLDVPGNQRFHLSGQGILVLEGRDAAAFAQAQTMNDVTALADGHWQWSGWLTPKGRVVALFALLRFNTEKLWLLLPDMPADVLAARLQTYVFRSKVKLLPLEDCSVNGGFAPPVQASGSRFALLENDAVVELDMGGAGGPRSLRIETAVAPEDAAAVARWAAFDLAHGLPHLSPVHAEHWTPQQLSLERLQAYSVKKGCYPGQEIVARTHFLGQAKRGLHRFHATAPVPVGSDVILNEQAIGQVVSSCDAEVLAVLPLDAAGDSMQAAGIDLVAQALLDGLQR